MRPPPPSSPATLLKVLLRSPPLAFDGHLRRHTLPLRRSLTAATVISPPIRGGADPAIWWMGLRTRSASVPVPALQQGLFTARAMGSLQYRDEGEGDGKGNGGFEQQKQWQQEKKLLTLPTVLTLGRVAAVPLLISTFYMDGEWATTATTSIFILAAITDWLDGYLARKMRLGTNFGAFLDPVADKLMVAATLVLLCTRTVEVSMIGEAPWLLTVPSIAIIGREITMSAVREWAASQNNRVLEAVAVNNLGKWKTATQMTALTIMLASRDPSLAGFGGIVASGVCLLYISAGLAIWSLVVYMGKIWRILLK